MTDEELRKLVRRMLAALTARERSALATHLAEQSKRYNDAHLTMEMADVLKKGPLTT